MTYLRFSNSRWYVYRAELPHLNGKDREALHIDIQNYGLDADSDGMPYSRVNMFLQNPDWEIFGGATLSQHDKDELLGAMRQFIADVDSECQQKT